MTYFDSVKNALLTVSRNVGHFKAFKKEPPYIVWAEDSADGSGGDNQNITQIISGTTDLFTKNLDGEPLVDAIQSAFNVARISWRLNSIQFEEYSGLLHYEWVWSVVNYG